MFAVDFKQHIEIRAYPHPYEETENTFMLESVLVDVALIAHKQLVARIVEKDGVKTIPLTTKPNDREMVSWYYQEQLGDLKEGNFDIHATINMGADSQEEQPVEILLLVVKKWKLRGQVTDEDGRIFWKEEPQQNTTTIKLTLKPNSGYEGTIHGNAIDFQCNEIYPHLARVIGKSLDFVTMKNVKLVEGMSRMEYMFEMKRNVNAVQDITGPQFQLMKWY